MIDRVIILEGSGDLTFIMWLIKKAQISLSESIKIIEAKGKPFVRPYIKKIIKCVNDDVNNINYGDIEVNKILLIKDFDLDDNINDYESEQLDLQQLGVKFDKYYISGTEPASRTLETLFIENDGELLREFVKLVKEFNQLRLQDGKDCLEQVNDKFLFHEFFRFMGKKSKLNSAFFDQIFSDASFSNFQDIKNLITRIKEFIEE